MKKKVITFLLITFLVIVYLVLGEHFNFHLKCPIHFITKLYCPGCGSTRMLKSLLNGKFYQAFRFNPLLFIVIPIYLLYLLGDLLSKKKLSKRLEPGLWYFLIGLFIFYGILRNIPLFKFLAPTTIG